MKGLGIIKFSSSDLSYMIISSESKKIYGDALKSI